jgi:hypothetical protein
MRPRRSGQYIGRQYIGWFYAFDGTRTSLALALALASLLLLFRSAQASININVEAVQKSIVFLYAADASGAVDSSKPIGTGFFVAIPLKSNPESGYVVVVTARHMLDPMWAKCPVASNPGVVYARLNKKDYKPGSGEPGVDFVRIDSLKDGQPIWKHNSDENVDAAVIPIPNPTVFSTFDINEVPVTLFPTDVEIANESIGDPAMSAGLLPGLIGKSRNIPIFKFGQISNIPSEDVETHCLPVQGSRSFLVKVWLIAANLVPGNSGSPIFHVPLGGGGIFLGGTRPMLLGVQSISFLPADIAGMTPIKYVWEILQEIGYADADFHRGPQLPAPQPPIPQPAR